MYSKSTSNCASASARPRNPLNPRVSRTGKGGLFTVGVGEEVKTVMSRTPGIVGLGLATAVALLLVSGARAEVSGSAVVAKRPRRHHRATRTYESTTTTTAAPVGRSIDELQGPVSNLRAQTVETTTQVKQLQQAITVAPPATANAAPKTIGEHVSVVEQS